MKTEQIIFTSARRAELLPVECAAPRAGEATVEMAFSAISAGTERANFVGDRNSTDMGENEEAVFPRTVGYSCTGIVTAIGEGVTRVAVGDRVVVMWGKHRKHMTPRGGCA